MGTQWQQHTDHHGFVNKRSQKTNETRVVTVFTYLPLWLNRFSWMQSVRVVERKYIVSELWFDDGNTYQHYWTPPKEEWIKEAILN
jgi:hypothetical protein